MAQVNRGPVVVRLSGGLGNQMFQFATGYALARDGRLPLMLDLSWYSTKDNRLRREFMLDQWQLPVDVIVSTDPGFEWLTVIKENRSYYWQHLEPQPCILDGHWQSERYFAHRRHELIWIFRPQHPETWRAFDVAVHVRRGDFVSLGRSIADEDPYYYERAMIKMGALRGDLLFRIFSDDFKWCAKRFGRQHDVIVIPSRKATSDLWAMSMHKYHIIGNSSFGWWGAWLCANPDQRVIYPQFISPKHPPASQCDYIPERWKQPTK